MNYSFAIVYMLKVELVVIMGLEKTLHYLIIANGFYFADASQYI